MNQIVRHACNNKDLMTLKVPFRKVPMIIFTYNSTSLKICKMYVIYIEYILHYKNIKINAQSFKPSSDSLTNTFMLWCLFSLVSIFYL